MQIGEGKSIDNTSLIKKKIKCALDRFCANVNKHFNNLSIQRRKAGVLGFGVVMGSISLALVVQAINGEQRNKQLSVETITIPNDIYMNEGETTMNDEQLIPVGKLKGEIDGEFKAFYLAVDKNGQTYINRSLDYSGDPYKRSKGWEEISKQDLRKFEKHLHFIPIRSKGLKH